MLLGIVAEETMELLRLDLFITRKVVEMGPKLLLLHFEVVRRRYYVIRFAATAPTKDRVIGCVLEVVGMFTILSLLHAIPLVLQHELRHVLSGMDRDHFVSGLLDWRRLNVDQPCPLAHYRLDGPKRPVVTCIRHHVPMALLREDFDTRPVSIERLSALASGEGGAVLSYELSGHDCALKVA